MAFVVQCIVRNCLPCDEDEDDNDDGVGGRGGRSRALPPGLRSMFRSDPDESNESNEGDDDDDDDDDDGRGGYSAPTGLADPHEDGPADEVQVGAVAIAESPTASSSSGCVLIAGSGGANHPSSDEGEAAEPLPLHPDGSHGVRGLFRRIAHLADRPRTAAAVAAVGGERGRYGRLGGASPSASREVAEEEEEMELSHTRRNGGYSYSFDALGSSSDRGIVPAISLDNVVILPGSEKQKQMSIAMAATLEEQGDECVICLEGFDHTNPRMPTLCGCGANRTYFHLPCLYQWIDQDRNCPSCRQRLRWEEF